MEGYALDHIIVKGGKKLTGKVRVEGAKNAVLPVLAGALLASEGKASLQKYLILQMSTLFKKY